MPKYAILANAGHNRVYFEASKALSIAELSLALERLGCEHTPPEGRDICGIYYVCFSSASLDSEALLTLARLSFVYAVFELQGEGESLCLRPLELPQALYIDGGLSSILKYSGKTNELFTRLMINAALLSTDFPTQDIRLLDPIAGKGTTLFEALSLGFDAYGAELSEKSVTDGYNYLKKFLEAERLKHVTATEKVNLQEKGLSAKRYSVDIARSKAEQKAGNTRHFELVAGNSMYADRFFKKNSFHIIVGDLPYGVQHGNVGAQKTGGAPTRSPKELISACGGAWLRVLKSGGALALSWNSFVYPREQFAAQLEALGFEVLRGGVYECFEHRVDQAIRRDLIVAKKPK